MRKTRFRGLERVGWIWTAAAYNLVRMRNLLGATAGSEGIRVSRVEIGPAARLPKANRNASANLALSTLTIAKSGMKRNLFVNEHFTAAC